MGKHFVTLKIKEETIKKFKKAKNLAEFKSEENITITEFLEELLEPYFKKYDGKIIERIDE